MGVVLPGDLRGGVERCTFLGPSDRQFLRPKPLNGNGHWQRVRGKLAPCCGGHPSSPRIPPVPPSGLPFPCERRDKSGVDSQLAPPPKWQPISYDLHPAVIQKVDAGDVQVCHPRVGGHPGTRFAANPSCCSLQWSSPTASEPRLRTCRAMVAQRFSDPACEAQSAHPTIQCDFFFVEPEKESAVVALLMVDVWSRYVAVAPLKQRNAQTVGRVLVYLISSVRDGTVGI